MKRFKLLTRMALMVSLAAMTATLTACNLPWPPGDEQPVATSPGAVEPTGGTGEMAEVPSAILTEVAATLFAPYQATWTAQAVNPPASTKPAQEQPTQAPPSPTVVPPTAIPTQAAPEQPTAAPTAALPTVAITLFPTAGITPLPTAYQPVLPPASFTAQTGQAYTVFGLNLHDCGGVYAANFLIENTGSLALESLSIHFIDLSSDQDLTSPTISNAPFAWTDRTCAPGGISRLEPGEWLFAGDLLGAGQLSGHNILANFLFCTQEDLNGQCYPRSVEFVVP